MGNYVSKRYSFLPHVRVPPHEFLFVSHHLPLGRNSLMNSYRYGYPSCHSNQTPYHLSIEHHSPLQNHFHIRKRESGSSSRSRSYGRYDHNV